MARGDAHANAAWKRWPCLNFRKRHEYRNPIHTASHQSAQYRVARNRAGAGVGGGALRTFARLAIGTGSGSVCVALVSCTHASEAKEMFLRVGIDPVPTAPEELVAIMNAEIARMGKVLRAAGMSAR